MTATAPGNQVKKISKLQTAAIIIIAFTVTIAAFYYLGVFDDFRDQTSPTNTDPSQTALTPARNLEGTWKTTFPVKF